MDPVLVYIPAQRSNHEVLHILALELARIRDPNDQNFARISAPWKLPLGFQWLHIISQLHITDPRYQNTMDKTQTYYSWAGEISINTYKNACPSNFTLLIHIFVFSFEGHREFQKGYVNIF